MVEARSPSNIGEGVAPLRSSPKTSTLTDPDHEPEPEADLALAPLPTAFDPDAEIVVLPPTSRLGEDELVVPIRSVEDEDAEEAALLESKRQAQAQALGQVGEGEGEEYDDEDDQDLNKILQSLAAGKGEGGEDEMDMDVDGEVDAEGEELLDEIVAQHAGPEQGGESETINETGVEAEEKNHGDEGIQSINVEQPQTALAEDEEREREIPSGKCP
jgi:hypothetical protein